jgi:hypothetical protein
VPNTVPAAAEKRKPDRGPSHEGSCPTALSTGRLRVASGLELAETLKDELRNFKLKVTLKTTNVSFEVWRENEHDDIFLAACLAAWCARPSSRPFSAL